MCIVLWVVGVGCCCGLLVWVVVAVHSECSLMDCKCLDLQTVEGREGIDLLLKSNSLIKMQIQH